MMTTITAAPVEVEEAEDEGVETTCGVWRVVSQSVPILSPSPISRSAINTHTKVPFPSVPSPRSTRTGITPGQARAGYSARLVRAVARRAKRVRSP